MCVYDKRIVYLSCMEYGSKIKRAGFAKMEFRDTACFLDMHISGVEEAEEGKYDIYVTSYEGQECSIGRILLYRGKGDYRASYADGMLEEKGIGCREIEKIYIGLSHGLQIQGKTGFKVDNKERAVREQKTDTGETEKKKSRIPETKAAEIGEERTDLLRERISPAEIRIEEVILNDKWAQLCQTYPVVHPYEDEREYISIQPKDFVIMTGDYQHLANNSFLLHGFYNYRHLILGREWQGDCFYLGVPGVYYEREKMVARMFGFEAFECSGGRAEAGRFGYYLRKVNI